MQIYLLKNILIINENLINQEVKPQIFTNVYKSLMLNDFSSSYNDLKNYIMKDAKQNKR